ncbi:MAG: hypothetical protein U5L95_00685 [Candidatus Saccharibacteria bacterium]|nr:hypothetical protein [Candidatus Saccharibacteria bacterium]
MDKKEQDLRDELADIMKQLEDPAIFSTPEYPKMPPKKDRRHTRALR